MVLPLNSLDRQPPVLLTDLYELTMAYAYWKSGFAERDAAFTMSFRKNPFEGGFTVFCGLSLLIDYLKDLRFSDSDVEYLSGIEDAHGEKLFEKGFLDYLRELRFDVDVFACKDGSVVFPHEPLIRIVGPIIPAQILETAILTLVGFPSLVATKAARIKMAADGDPVYEFGLRRAQGMDGGLSASLAAYLGGCDGTSNTLAGKIFGIPVKGTHAHSWVMAHKEEVGAFREYAAVMPSNCVFLVDTFDTISGVENAIRVGLELKSKGYVLAGIRLDSGDLAYLSIQARKMLDDAGLVETKIFASNDLDEHIISSLKDQGARIDAWAVGTKLVTGADNPSLGCVYKLSAVRNGCDSSSGVGDWRYCLKLSEQTVKVSTPGVLQSRRFVSGSPESGRFIGDMVFDELMGEPAQNIIVDPADFTRRKKVSKDASFEDLLLPIYKKGQLVYEYPGFEKTRDYVSSQLAGFHSGIKRLLNPHQYPVGLELSLNQVKTDLILEARGHKNEEYVKT